MTGLAEAAKEAEALLVELRAEVAGSVEREQRNVARGEKHRRPFLERWTKKYLRVDTALARLREELGRAGDEIERGRQAERERDGEVEA